MPFLTGSSFARWRDGAEAKHHGIRDAGIPIPRAGDREHPRFIFEIKNVAGSQVRTVCQQWHREYSRIQKFVDRERIQMKDAQERKNQAEKELEEEEDKYIVTHDEPPAGSLRSPWAGYRVLMLFLFLCELPLNAVVFRTFGENEVFTFLFTVGLALLLLYCAHILGAFCKEGIRNWTRLVFTVLSIIVPLGVIVGVAYWRMKYIGETVPEAAKDAGVIIGFFAGVNALFYLVATVASFRTHDEVRDGVLHAQHNVQRWRAADLRAQKALEGLKVEREATYARFSAKALQVTDAAHRLIEIYRKYNERTRGESLTWPDYPRFDACPELVARPWLTHEAEREPSAPTSAARGGRP